MYVANREAVLIKAIAALQTLQNLAVPFGGPFVTPHDKRVYLTDGCLLAKSEIVVLHEADISVLSALESG